jgi:hypothetical protein
LGVVDLRFADPIFLTDFKTYPYKYKRKMLSFKFKDEFGFYDSNMAFRSLKYSYVGKENIGGKPTQIWIRNIVFSLQICGFAICVLRHHGHLQICYMRTGTPKKFADLRLAE